ncbi:MAG: PilX N-terminal domain-containing pilus assembly protein [Gammaproteobacteria bacterium]|nr:PilX N-terminal domain-containing pilus assembly protein [Gammaproteobacteria bacterium]
MRTNINTRTQTGMVLVICLIMLLVLTLVAAVAMRSTTVDLQMTTNTMLKTRAFQGSESGRVMSTGVLSSHVFYRGWPGNIASTASFTLPDYLDVTDSNSELWVSNNADLGDMSAGAEDMTYMVDGNNDGDYDAQEDINSTIYVTKLGAAVPISGSGLGQVMGGEGAGVGAAGSGAAIYFDVRARGLAPGNARSVTGVDYRHVVNN